MIATQFSPNDIEALVRTAVELAETEDATGLSDRQQHLINQARNALMAEYLTDNPPPQRTTLIDAQVPQQVWVLRRWDRHDDEVSVWTHSDHALSWLAAWVRDNWDMAAGSPGVPATPPADDHTAIDLYYRALRTSGDEDYWLEDHIVRIAP
jgi:hypothetical protein